MTRRKLTTLIVAGLFAAALLSMELLKTNEPAAPQTTQDAERPADTTPEQIQQAPRSSQDVFMPPPTELFDSTPTPPCKVEVVIDDPIVVPGPTTHAIHLSAGI